MATACLAMSASGHFIPPLFIFPRERVTIQLKKGAPPGSLFRCNPKGWMTCEDFFAWFEHFLQHANPSADRPVLLVLDGHASHTKNLALIDKARQYHVTIVSIQPHTSHRTQPLDVSRPLKTAFSRSIENFMKSNPGRVVTLNEIAELVDRAFLRVACPETAVSGFRATGIWPFNRAVFCDEDFAPADVTDLPPPQSAVVALPDETHEEEPPLYGFDSLGFEFIPNYEDFDGGAPNIPYEEDNNKNDSIQSMADVSFNVTPDEILPLPKMKENKTRRGRKEKAALITGSPYRKALRTLQADKEITMIVKAKKRKFHKPRSEKRENFDSRTQSKIIFVPLAALASALLKLENLGVSVVTANSGFTLVVTSAALNVAISKIA